MRFVVEPRAAPLLTMARPSAAFLASLAALAAAVGPLASGAQDSGGGVTLITPAGRERIDTIAHDGREMLALDDLARRFRLDVREDSRSGTLSVSSGDAAVILTPDQQLVSVDGRLVSLRAAPRRIGGRWMAPLDFLNRALAPVHDEPLEFRPQSRLLLVGDVRAPQVAARYRAGAGAGRLLLDVTPRTPYEVEERTGRLVVTFDADYVDLVDAPRTDGALVTGFGRAGSAPGVAIDLGPAFDSYRVSSAPASNGGATLLIELRSAAAAADAAPAPVPAPAPAAADRPAAADPLPDFSARPAVRVVAIDPGHGGGDSGSRGGGGALEKAITLDVARKLRTAIETRLGLRVVLTRERDETVELDARAAIANNNGADLFISLHVNASARPSATGAEVFHLSIDEYDAEARELAEQETEPVPVFGGGSRGIDLVLWETAQLLYVDASAQLAAIVEAELRRRVAMSPRPLRQAPFRVLVGANMPAVLVELGSIADPADESRLAGAPFQTAVVDALVASIRRFSDDVERAARRGSPAAGL